MMSVSQSFDQNTQIHEIYRKKNQLSLYEQTLIQSAAAEEHSPVHDFQQECQIWTRLTIEHFSTSWPTGHDGASRPCSHMASFLLDRALVGICRWHGGLCLPTVVSGSIPEPI